VSVQCTLLQRTVATVLHDGSELQFRAVSFPGPTELRLLSRTGQETCPRARHDRIPADFDDRLHSCALVSESVWCWGANSNGQLGNGTTTDSEFPVQVISANVQAIAAGSAHTCAITTSGSLLCWGDNSHGAVGDGTTADRWTPVQVQGLSTGVQAVTNGAFCTCAIANGAALCWGWNVSGQLGDNSNTTRLTPTAVMGLTSGVEAITAGYGHSCALTEASAKCWGDNSYGQLGDNSTVNSLTPVLVQGLR